MAPTQNRRRACTSPRAQAHPSILLANATGPTNLEHVDMYCRVFSRALQPSCRSLGFIKCLRAPLWYHMASGKDWCCADSYAKASVALRRARHMAGAYAHPASNIARPWIPWTVPFVGVDHGHHRDNATRKCNSASISAGNRTGCGMQSGMRS